MHSTGDFYEILGVPRDAPDADIRRAFRALAKEHHPDSRLDRGDAPEHDFRLITEAYETLKDPARRAAYDDDLASARQLSSPIPGSGRRPVAFAAGLGVGVAVALVAVVAFFYLGRGKSGDKAQDSLNGAIVLRDGAEAGGDASRKAPGALAQPDASRSEAVEAPPPPPPPARPAEIAAAPAQAPEPRAASSSQDQRKPLNRAIAPGEAIALTAGISGDERILRVTPGKGQSEGFSDCPFCPEMVVIPNGQTTMGSRPESDGYRSEEAPPHRIAIGKPLAISKSVISAANWRACVDAGVCRLTLSSLLAVGPRAAATRISWFDAKTYVEWLSQTTGRRYRLLTEAEWEYAAKGGARANSSGKDRYVLDSDLLPRVRFERASEPGANGWGIASGNVLEWVEDCWHANYDQAPSDASAWLSASGGDCAYRVVRGSAKASGSFGWRPSARAREFADANTPTVGFRVAREIVALEER
jgi:formylglycine-generating enzyme required for sulfatase activity